MCKIRDKTCQIIVDTKEKQCGKCNIIEKVLTFIRKNVILVNRSTVDFKSISFSGLDAGKLFRYIDRSIRSELCNWSNSLTNFSFCIEQMKSIDILINKCSNQSNNNKNSITNYQRIVLVFFFSFSIQELIHRYLHRNC